MKKWKSRIEFIVIMLVILIAYFIMIENVEYFITQYEDKTMDYPNDYIWEEKEEALMKSINTATVYESLTEEERNSIKMNKMVVELFKHIFETTDEETVKMVFEETVKMMSKANGGQKIPDTKYGDLIHLQLGRYTLVFTKDFKNIYCFKNIYYSSNASVAEVYTDASYHENIYTKVEASKEQEMMKDKEKVLENINQILNDMGVTKEVAFEPDSFYWKTYNQEIEGIENMHIYVVEDSVHKIKISYDLDDNKLVAFMMGF